MKRGRWWFFVISTAIVVGIFLGLFTTGCDHGQREKLAEDIHRYKALHKEKSSKDIYSKAAVISDTWVGPTQVTWSVDAGKDRYLVPLIIIVLEDSGGWSRAGVDFKYDPKEQSGFHIFFETYSLNDANSPCNSLLSGCANVESAEDGLRCVVSFVDKSSDVSALYDGVAFWKIVNHEVGHCFGLTHSTYTGDVMFPDDGREIPTPSLQEIITLARLLKSGEVYAAIEELHGIELSKK